MRPLLAFLFSMLSLPVAAHEFWIEPETYQVEPGVSVIVRLRNGQEFEGVELAYFSQRFERFERGYGILTAPVEGRNGDRPAATLADLPEGLHTIVYEASTQRVEYDTLEDFMRFVVHKDLGPVDEMHRARGLPEVEFYEAYSRHAKSLIAVGEGVGADRSFGMAIELVALENPYTDDTTDGLTVALERFGERRGDAQIELFERAPNGDVEITLHRTDADGVVILPVKAGHEYLVDSVILLEPSAEVVSETGAVWETHWASLTFEIPIDQNGS